jgi:hypothetical protein
MSVIFGQLSLLLLGVFGLGGGELVLMTGFLASIGLIVVAVRGGRLRAAFMRLSEAAVFRQAVVRLQDSDEKPLEGLSFPVALAVAAPASLAAVALYGWAAFTCGPIESHEARWTYAALESTPIVFPILLFILAGLPGLGLFVAIYMHFRPGHDRRLKYEFLLMWASSMSWMVLVRKPA